MFLIRYVALLAHIPALLLLCDTAGRQSVAPHQAIGVQRSDRSDQRLLVHHYSLQIPPIYFSLPMGMPSPDGKVVIFNSNMNGSGPYDLFVAEMPLR